MEVVVGVLGRLGEAARQLQRDREELEKLIRGKENVSDIMTLRSSDE